jgi:hypothetical protein
MSTFIHFTQDQAGMQAALQQLMQQMQQQQQQQQQTVVQGNSSPVIASPHTDLNTAPTQQLLMQIGQLQKQAELQVQYSCQKFSQKVLRCCQVPRNVFLLKLQATIAQFQQLAQVQQHVQQIEPQQQQQQQQEQQQSQQYIQQQLAQYQAQQTQLQQAQLLHLLQQVTRATRFSC